MGNLIKTSSLDDIKPYIQDLYSPADDSHKGQNGKVMVIGGSSLFHAASIWAAEVASYFTDMVHYSSIEENNDVVKNLKGLFRNGIVVSQKEIPAYIEEDDSILIGPGMVRRDIQESERDQSFEKFEDILKTEDEALRTRNMVKYLIEHYPHKQFIFDAGALQMMDATWLQKLQKPPIITPHQQEFERIFKQNVTELSVEQKKELVKKTAAEHKCIILLKAVVDIVSNGTETVTIEGGNAGLTKGGTGDVLAGVVTALSTKNDPFKAAVLGSYLEKKAAEELYTEKDTWYNVADLIDKLPRVLKQLKENL